MRTVSVSVSEADDQRFREVARTRQQPIAQLIREAMAYYRANKLDQRSPLRDLPTLPGHRLITELPSRDEIYDEIHGQSESLG